ncbi:P-loop protein of unknown function [Thermosyntropha lipolytica DSM 11003]|uniref:Uncharacterized protein n=1 Tax=Thermosyntropha lipolytica DSM 11003 TaxID=1123382 RepID=A0A1M5PP95_9FIRM|nr:BREX system ATP-binding domain-containing protein [Thermosyntropha lipolytica]SHH03607.1 P-loop protein of unknown function [Thermosyntropha lipolytica DSM 11003]
MLTERDLACLREGKPPSDPQVLEEMTLGYELWPYLVKEHYLDFFIKEGGSKVKILVGKEGSGKSHLLKLIEVDARQQGYETVSFSLRQDFFKFNDMVSLYRMVAEGIDVKALSRDLARQFAVFMGYQDVYDGTKTVYELMVEGGIPINEARREFIRGAASFVKKADLPPSFQSFVYSMLKAMLESEEECEALLAIAGEWLQGKNLNRNERSRIQAFEKLNKGNARSWLDALVKVLVLAGRRGLVLLIDDGEVIADINPETGRHYYTPGAVKDVCEMIRQFIDDGDLLRHLFIVIAGRPEMLEDMRRGFKSYEALWMRIQSGLTGIDRFNSLADVVEVDKYFNLLLKKYEVKNELNMRLQTVLKKAGFKRRMKKGLELPQTGSLLKDTVMEVAWLATRE